MTRSRRLLVFASSLLSSFAFAQDCAHCGMPIPKGDKVTVQMGGKTVSVRCMLCARDLAAQSPGAATVAGPTEDPARPLVMRSDDKGDWTANLPEVVFLEVEGDHALCNRWSRAFTSVAAFRRYVAENPLYKDAKPLALADWAAKEGAQEMGRMGMPGHMDHETKGALGPWSMAREGSGTTWLPDDSPMFMKGLGKKGRYNLYYMGNFSLNYTDSSIGGKRGEKQFFSNSMPMLMARRDVGGGTLSFRLMGSLDPVFNGRYGYPNLFQTGETAYGSALKDRQHPHDLLSEVSVTFSKALKGDTRGFLYLAPIGEPALGGSMFLMRPSGMENPEAPISHHWFDSTHITFGVATAGLTFGDKWKVEASAFKGEEPDENRYSPDNLRLDSASTRLTYSPTRNLSFSGAYGYLKDPEPGTEPGDDQRRITASAHYGKGDLAVTALFGRNIKQDGHASDAYLLEVSLFRGDWSTYARFENVAKDELVDVPAGTYRVDKLTFGATRDFARRGGFDFGLGAYAGLYGVPSGLRDTYGDFPVTAGVYFRIRPSRMGRGGMETSKPSREARVRRNGIPTGVYCRRGRGDPQVDRPAPRARGGSDPGAAADGGGRRVLLRHPHSARRHPVCARSGRRGACDQPRPDLHRRPRRRHRARQGETDDSRRARRGASYDPVAACPLTRYP